MMGGLGHMLHLVGGREGVGTTTTTCPDNLLSSISNFSQLIKFGRFHTHPCGYCGYVNKSLSCISTDNGEKKPTDDVDQTC